ncbi:hypothetical protein DFH06DRAFT_1135766 [Mycena polygramma]|nr:hypothetical protein DFH06DRAFT_1135766 [Mycena polygramma]
MWNGKRFYIGEIMDVYKKAASSRYGSIEDATTASGLSYLSLRVYLALGTGATETEADAETEADTTELWFSCYDRKAHLHTHAEAQHMIFNLGPDIFDSERDSGGVHRVLLPRVASRWNVLTRPGKVSEEIQTLTIKVPKRSPGPGHVQ